MIDENYKFISIDIPRTAGSARARLFSGVPIDDDESTSAVQTMRMNYWSVIPKHANAKLYIRRAHIKFLTYYKFTFVRNPWDRMVSFFHYRQRKFGANKFERYIKDNEFNDLKIQQLDYITYYKSCSLVDFIGRFENLYDDFDKICENINFPHRLPNEPWKIPTDYVSFYNDDTRKIVAENFAKDIEYFNYKFGQ